MFVKSLVVLPLLGFGILSAMSSLSIQDQDEIKESRAPFMIKKLDHVKGIVAGLAREDFESIAKNAQDLMLLSHEVDWNVLQTPDYLDMSAEFRKSAERLRESAHEKNLDGAALAYFDVTLNCVRCHKYVRKNEAKLPNQ